MTIEIGQKYKAIANAETHWYPEDTVVLVQEKLDIPDENFYFCYADGYDFPQILSEAELKEI